MAAPTTRSRTTRSKTPAEKATPAAVKEELKENAQATAPRPDKKIVDTAAVKAEKDKSKAEAKAEKDKEKREAEAKARQAKIDAGDLIVKDGKEFERNTKETKVYGQIAQIVDLYRDSDVPLVFAEVVDEIGARYPEDLVPALHALEHLGLVQRYDARTTGSDSKSRRGSAAYMWVNEG